MKEIVQPGTQLRVNSLTNKAYRIPRKERATVNNPTQIAILKGTKEKDKIPSAAKRIILNRGYLLTPAIRGLR